MPAPIAKKAALRPPDLDEMDLLDRTMEVDMRWLQYEKDAEQANDSPRPGMDDPTVVLDLSSTQVHDLLTVKKK